MSQLPRVANECRAVRRITNDDITSRLLGSELGVRNETSHLSEQYSTMQ